MTEYFTGSMETKAPEARYRICWSHDLVSLQQRAKGRFAVRYGMQVKADLTYGDACKELGSALMHQMACDSLIDNRDKGER